MVSQQLLLLSVLLPSSAALPQTATLNLKLFQRTSSVVAHPSVEVTVEDGYKVISGGAYVSYSGPGQLLTASYPVGETKWIAKSKDHLKSSHGTVTAVAMGLHDPNDEWEVFHTSEISGKTAHPSTMTHMTQNYRMVGGGAIDHWTGQGNLLTGSYPYDEDTWKVSGKDHLRSDPARIMAFAIGRGPI